MLKSTANLQNKTTLEEEAEKRIQEDFWRVWATEGSLATDPARSTWLEGSFRTEIEVEYWRLDVGEELKNNHFGCCWDQPYLVVGDSQVVEVVAPGRKVIDVILLDFSTWPGPEVRGCSGCSPWGWDWRGVGSSCERNIIFRNFAKKRPQNKKSLSLSW